MTAFLEKAFAKASHLPELAQQQLAEQMLEDMAGELKWDKTLARSQNILESMAGKASTARRTGKTIKRGFDEL